MTGSATKQSMLPLRRDGLLRFARNDDQTVSSRLKAGTTPSLSMRECFINFIA
jgi:hypothetical protein